MKKTTLRCAVPCVAALTGLAAAFACGGAPARVGGSIPVGVSPAITTETEPVPAGTPACAAIYTDGSSLLASLGCTNGALMVPPKGACEITSQTLWACPNSALGNPRLADIGAYLDPNQQPYPRCGPPSANNPNFTRLQVGKCRVSVTFTGAVDACVGNPDAGWFLVAEELIAGAADVGGGVPCAGGCAVPTRDVAWLHP